MCSWDTTEDDVQQFAAALERAATAVPAPRSGAAASAACAGPAGISSPWSCRCSRRSRPWPRSSRCTSRPRSATATPSPTAPSPRWRIRPSARSWRARSSSACWSAARPTCSPHVRCWRARCRRSSAPAPFRSLVRGPPRCKAISCSSIAATRSCSTSPTPAPSCSRRVRSLAPDVASRLPEHADATLVDLRERPFANDTLDAADRAAALGDPRAGARAGPAHQRARHRPRPRPRAGPLRR